MLRNYPFRPCGPPGRHPSFRAKPSTMKLSADLVSRYREEGYLLLEDVIPESTLARLRQAIDRYVEKSRSATCSNREFDLDRGHTAKRPRLRRLKDPHLRDPVFRELAESDAIVEPAAQLLNGTVRFDHSKLNFKHPDASAEIHWHQDWAFYPHTNDDILAVGVMIEDCTPASGPLRVIPGSHLGPLYDHHYRGLFAGAVQDDALADLIPGAVDLTGPAGSVSIHHVRTLHASANCTANTTRPLLLLSYAAVDAFPIFDMYDLAEFDSRILRGEPVRAGRMEALPVRLPLPRQAGADSIYDNQSVAGAGTD